MKLSVGKAQGMASMLLCLSVAVSGQVISGISVDAITHTSARVTWTTDTSANARLYYGLKSDACPSASQLGYATRWKGNSTRHGITVGGLKPSSTYCFAPKSGDNFGPVGELMTLPEPADRFRAPTLPAQADLSMPVVNGTTFAVDSANNCNDSGGLQARLGQAAARADSLNHEVVIPAGSVCIGNYKLPTRAGTGWIILRTSTTGNGFTPEGVRANPSWSNAMAKISVPSQSYWEGDAALEAAWPNGSTKWRIVGLELTHEAFPHPGELNTVIGATNTYPIEITTAGNHGWSTSDVVQVYGVGGNTAANGSRTITVTAPNKFTIGVAGNEEYTGGGGVARNPAYHNSLASFEWGTSADIILDRCYIHGRGFPYRSGYGVVLRCANCGVINSHLSNLNYWRGVKPGSPNEYVSSGTTVNPTVLDISWGSPIIDNNYIEMGNGVTLFAQGSPDYPVPTDIRITRNHFYGPPSMRHNTTNNAGSTDGRYYQHRQFLEFKRGKRILIDGNLFENQWSDGITGGHTMVFTPRVEDPSKPYSSDSRIEDVTITNNIVRNASGTIGLVGTDDVPWGDTPVGARWKIANNLFYGIDGYYWKTNQATSGDSIHGNCLMIGGAIEDFVYDHNTCFDNKGNQPADILFLVGRGSGFKVTNNIFSENSTNGIHGFNMDGGNDLLPTVPQYPTNALAMFQGIWKSTPDADTRSTFSNNVMIPGIRDTAVLSCYTSTDTYGCNFNKYTCDQIWSGFTSIFCAGSVSANVGTETAADRIASMKFENADGGDLSLRADSPYKTGSACNGGPCTSDGKDPGTDMRELEKAQGKVRDAAVVFAGDTQAAISYVAPDGFACSVEVSANQDYSGSMRMPDGANNRERMVVVENLVPNTQYYYRVLCAVEQPTGTFTTIPTAEGGTAEAVTITLQPPEGREVENVVVEYGSTASLGQTTSPEACRSGCTVQLPRGNGKMLYFRTTYRTASNSVVAESRLQIAP